MIVKVDAKISSENLERIIERLQNDYKLKLHFSYGEEYIIIGVVGDTSVIDTDRILSIDGVADVQRVRSHINERVENFIQRIQL